MACISKTAGCRAKRTESWDSGILVTHIWSTFDLVGFKGHFGVIGCICLEIGCISKTAGRRTKRSEIWHSWIIVPYVWGAFDVVGSRSLWGHLVHFPQNGF